jgi:methionine synthase I (cobalamin-dependent)
MHAGIFPDKSMSANGLQSAREKFSALLKSVVVVTDGAWGTQLQTPGRQSEKCLELLNITAPDCVEALARSYIHAGSRIVLTNTFGANRIALSRCGLETRVEEINRAGVELSKHAAGRSALVFASMGPSGTLQLVDNVPRQRLSGAFSEQAEALARSGADGIVIETMTDVEEAVLALHAARSTGLPVVVCMVFDSGPGFDHTMMGVPAGDVAEILAREGADVVGANCGIGIESAAGVCRQLRAATSLPIWIKPNAGLPQIVGDSLVYPTGPESFALHVPDLIAAGATFVGGCCGTTPEHIRAIRVVIRDG